MFVTLRFGKEHCDPVFSVQCMLIVTLYPTLNIWHQICDVDFTATPYPPPPTFTTYSFCRKEDNGTNQITWLERGMI
jgi:hypothetical protein